MSAQPNMNLQQGRLLQILQKPHMSEKATIVAEKYRQFVFQVAPEATKNDIKQAVEALFAVNVINVRVSTVKSKERRFKQTVGQRRSWKKAYVTLKEGQDINFTGTK